jgi:hypothetical protein
VEFIKNETLLSEVGDRRESVLNTCRINQWTSVKSKEMKGREGKHTAKKEEEFNK